RVWVQQFDGLDEPVRLRTKDNLPSAATLIVSPYDAEARWSTKRSVDWVGYKVHLTETCDPNRPRLLTHVETTLATTPDIVMLDPINEALAAKDLLPAEHVVDTGYVTIHHVVRGQAEHGVRVVGPVHADASWQAQMPGAYDIGAFVINWEAKRVT